MYTEPGTYQRCYDDTDVQGKPSEQLKLFCTGHCIKLL